MNEINEIRPRLTDKNIISRIYKYIKTQKKAYIISFFMMIVAVGLDLLLPVLLGKVSAILGKENQVFTSIAIIIGIYSACLLFTYLLEFIQTMTLQKTGQAIIYTVREDVFKRIEKFPIATLNVTPVGKLVTRVTSDISALNELFTNIIINLIKNGLTIIGVLIVMFFINPLLSLVILGMCPLVLGLSIIFRKTSRKVYRLVRGNVANINAFLSENLSGMKITQVFNQEGKKLKEFQERNRELRKSTIKQVLTFALFRPAIYILYLATVILVFWIGSYNVIHGGSITFDILIVFYQFIDRLFNPIQQIAEEFNVLQSAFASSERIFETLDSPIEKDAEDAIELNDIKGEIEFKNVWFRYIEDEWILKDVSFKINAGDTVAFVGATGSGKTTILSLIVRNYDIQAGQILIDGIDIKKIKLASLRKNIGQMLQDVFLFSGTILSNIQMREENINFEDIKKSCEYVNADKFIEQLPDKYQEIVRERGNNFSSGQRQLLSFARTVVHKPKIMILDEATANIDTETEVLIQDSLAKMMNIGTMIMVAHRLSTIQHANNIIVLQKGVIIEQGTHQELLKKKGHYYKLYQLQYQKK